MLGFLSRKFAIISQKEAQVLNRFIYYFALPALFIAKVAKINLEQLELKLVISLLLPILMILMLLWVGFQVLKIINKDQFILFSLAIIFGSNSFFGVAFFESLAGKAGLDFAVIASAVLGPIGVFLCMVLFEYQAGQMGIRSFGQKMLKNPLIISIFIGMLFFVFGLQDSFLIKAFTLLGKSAGPTAIFTLGIFVYDNFSVQALKKSAFYALFRLIVLPVVTVFLVFLLNISGEIKEFLILQSGLPAAVAIAVFAEKYDYKKDIISNIVIITSVFCFVVLGILAFFV